MEMAGSFFLNLALSPAIIRLWRVGDILLKICVAIRGCHKSHGQ